jgi:hypothetical protein
MTASPRFPTWLPIAALLFAAAHLGFEHFNGGVQSHHLLQRADMPSISNWLGLGLLPLLVALVVSTVSLVARSCFRAVASVVRGRRVP